MVLTLNLFCMQSDYITPTIIFAGIVYKVSGIADTVITTLIKIIIIITFQI